MPLSFLGFYQGFYFVTDKLTLEDMDGFSMLPESHDTSDESLSWRRR